jgi:H+/Cl- antiporter ClcA
MKNKDWLLLTKAKFQRVRQNKYANKFIEKIDKHLPYESIPLWLASVATGLIAVLYERLFEVFEHWGIQLFEYNNYLIFVSAPLFMLAAWLLVEKLSKASAGSGIPQLMVSVEIADTKRSKFIDYFLNIKVIVIKISSSLLMLLGGGAIGREGPTLQIAGSVFQFAHKLVPSHWPKVSQRNMLITGGASGLAAAFNTPLGGIVYVVEELTKSHIGKFRTAVFTAVIISGMTAQLFLGSYLYLGFPKIAVVPLWGIFWVVAFAFVAGIAGAVFSKILLLIDIQRKRINNFKIKLILAIVASLSFALLVYFTGKFSIGTGKPLLNEILFTKNDIPWYMFPARFFGCIFTFAVGAAGGIFATSLASGASLGTLLISVTGISAQYHNLLVLVAMIGFLTGVTRSPFTAAILVLEMTDRHSAIFYFLMAGLVSNIGASLVLKHSFYDYQRIAFLKQIDEVVKVTRKKLKPES